MVRAFAAPDLSAPSSRRGAPCDCPPAAPRDAFRRRSAGGRALEPSAGRELVEEPVVNVEGAITTVLGLAAMAIGQSLCIVNNELFRASFPGGPEGMRTFDRVLVLQTGLELAGAAAACVGVAELLPDEPGMPWWAWLSGGAGLVVASVGIGTSVGQTWCAYDVTGKCHPFHSDDPAIVASWLATAIDRHADAAERLLQGSIQAE